MMLTPDLEEVMRVGLRYARYGVDVAATSVSYASDVLRDVSKHLRDVGTMLAPDRREARGNTTRETNETSAP